MTNQKQIEQFLLKYGELLLHTVLLLLYFGAINVSWSEDWTIIEGRKKDVLPVSALAFPVVFYLNTFVLIHRLLKQKRWLTYGLVLGTLLFAIGVGKAALFGFQKAGNGFWNDFLETFTGPGASLDAIAIGLIVSFGYRFSKDWIVNLTEIERLKAERLEMELAFLKSQVDPHFLFNTLNTIYAVALEEGGAKTADSITKLATLMRYNLHEAKRTFIPVEKEIGYIQKYIELQKLRLTDRNKVDWKVTIDKEVSETTQIAPMLLISFVENAFKYGVSPTENTLMHMEIVVDRTSLIMELSNTIIKNAGKKAKGGVGIDNVRKRLEHIYPDRHQLRFGREGNEFHVYLEINFDQ